MRIQILKHSSAVFEEPDPEPEPELVGAGLFSRSR